MHAHSMCDFVCVDMRVPGHMHEHSVCDTWVGVHACCSQVHVHVDTRVITLVTSDDKKREKSLCSGFSAEFRQLHYSLDGVYCLGTK